MKLKVRMESIAFCVYLLCPSVNAEVFENGAIGLLVGILA